MKKQSIGVGLMGLGVVAGAVSGTGIGFLALGGILLIVAGFIATLILWWDHLVGFWRATVGPAITRLFTAFGKLSEALGGAKTGMGLLKAATLPFALALDVVMIALTAILTIITKVVSSITWLTNTLKGAGELLSGIFGGAENSMKSFNDTHNDMVDDIEDAYGRSIGDMMAEQYDTAKDALESLIEVQAMPTPISNQNITINMEFSGAISADMDLDSLTAEISRKLAAKIEGVY